MARHFPSGPHRRYQSKSRDKNYRAIPRRFAPWPPNNVHVPISQSMKFHNTRPFFHRLRVVGGDVVSGTSRTDTADVSDSVDDGASWLRRREGVDGGRGGDRIDGSFAFLDDQYGLDIRRRPYFAREPDDVGRWRTARCPRWVTTANDESSYLSVSEGCTGNRESDVVPWPRCALGPSALRVLRAIMGSHVGHP